MLKNIDAIKVLLSDLANKQRLPQLRIQVKFSHFPEKE